MIVLEKWFDDSHLAKFRFDSTNVHFHWFLLYILQFSEMANINWEKHLFFTGWRHVAS